MKLLCINSPVKSLIKEGKQYEILKNISGASVKVIFDELGVPFYLTPVPGLDGMYKSRIGDSTFMFKVVDDSFEKHQKKLRNERRVELTILFIGAIIVTAYMLTQG